MGLGFAGRARTIGAARGMETALGARIELTHSLLTARGVVRQYLVAHSKAQFFNSNRAVSSRCGEVLPHALHMGCRWFRLTPPNRPLSASLSIARTPLTAASLTVFCAPAMDADSPGVGSNRVTIPCETGQRPASRNRKYLIPRQLLSTGGVTHIATPTGDDWVGSRESR